MTEFLINFENWNRTLSQSVEQLESIRKITNLEFEAIFSEVGQCKTRLHLIEIDFNEITKSLEASIDVYWQAENLVSNLIQRLPTESLGTRDRSIMNIEVSRISGNEHIVDNWLNQLLWNEEDENS